ncbi:MAG: tripartite tricarboxylate transporter permease [Burkholderiaceae bacterium]
MFEKGRRQVDITTFETGPTGSRPRFAKRRRIRRALTIGSLVGILIGLIPGVGGQIAGLVAYDQSRKFSPQRSRFGEGVSEGVIAAECANNAMVGPSLVPLLTLSIPGSPTAAVLLGGLLIHGIFPGSDLFENHPEVAWTFIDAMLIGQLLMVVLGLYLAGLAARVARVPQSIMAGTVLVLSVFGAYAVQQSYADVLVMAVLGVGMHYLGKLGFSAAPLVLGLILGPIAETNYVQGRLIAEAGNGMADYFLSGPLNLTLIGVCLASVVYSVWMERRERAREHVLGEAA